MPVSVQAAYCVVSGRTLEAAVVAYARACSAPREDCDKLPDGQWACASFDNPTLSDLGLDSSASDNSAAEDSGDVAPEPTVPDTEPTPVSDPDVGMDATRCVAAGESLSKAVRRYADNCSLPRRDCDATGLRGQYLCASFNNPTLADLQALQDAAGSDPLVTDDSAQDTGADTGSGNETAGGDEGETVTEQPVVEEPAVEEPVSPQLPDTAGSDSADECTAIGGNLREAISNYAMQCTQKRVDCDPYADGYVCGSYRNPVYVAEEDTVDADEGGSAENAGGAQPVPDEDDIPAVADGDDSSASESGNDDPSVPAVSLPAGSIYTPGDFIALHYDNAPDPDDGHAAVAGRMVIAHFGLEEVTGVVSGAYGAPVAHLYREDSEPVFYATWGEEGVAGGWFNAHRQREVSLQNSADQWQSVLLAGGRVLVAEGGQSDYTADVMRELAERDSALDLSRIWVFQHSYGPKSFNESQATQADLSYVKAHATYVKVPDGNTQNASADLNERNDAVANRFLASAQFGEAWSAAFTYLNPFTRKFDASDTVELLYILGLDSRDIAGWDDFSDYFLPQD
ncbi:hypothetical protein Q4485_12035 [Granulosicoccaceae sp. 1_MG-2023]|nr:hypothetical protein [Granulosicoccaceae sp. 1_MG-2023]